MFGTIIKFRFTEMKRDANRRHIFGHASTLVSRLMQASWRESERAIFVQTNASDEEAIRVLIAKAMPRQYMEEVVAVRATRTQ
jgi:hypothetical protein